jgi:hypothetical protein
MSKRIRAAVTVLCLAAAGAGAVAAATSSGSDPVSPLAGSHGRAARARESAETATSIPQRSSPASTPAPATPASGPASARPPASPAPSGSRHGGSAAPSWGVYVDARDSGPHYVLSLAGRGPGTVQGGANYVYPGGAEFIGRYTGTLSGGRLTLRFGAGTVVTGRYRNGRLILPGCSSVLTRAVNPADCTFTYNGNDFG